MKKKQGFIFGIVMMMLFMIAACGNTADEAAEENEPQKETQSEDNEPEQDSMTEEASVRAEDAATDDAETDINEEDPAEATSDLKAEYLEKLTDAQEELAMMRNDSKDGITYELKAVEGDGFDMWDGLLNEVYGVLQEQLPANEMDQLRQEQREWIDHRDAAAKEASLEYEGGTMEQLEYTTVLNELTEERCFELVETYMN